ncbi:MAG TPA: hypothetical protein VE173_07050, partial [Longimicrobiales bacterium]|nr:hypothetical protein [Longimicrobiales bacterium]
MFHGIDALRSTPSGIDHYSGYVNRFDMTGDLVGHWWFQGTVHWNTRSGKVTDFSRPVLVEINASALGKVGTFECVGSFHIRDYPGPDYVQEGNVTGCHGTGDFEGMKM